LFSKSWIVTGLEGDEERRGEVVYRLLSVYNLPSWNNVNRMIRMRTK
jgi:hypothetical protein